MTESQLLELFRAPEGCTPQETLENLEFAAKQLCLDVQSPRRRRTALLALYEYRHQLIMDSLEQE